MQLILVRHGESRANVAREQAETELSEVIVV
jgi:broad specificity phosphatase PhoE